MGTSRLLLITPQVRSRESYLLQLLSELVSVSVLSLKPPYRPVEPRGPQTAEHRLVGAWKWLWPAEQWIGDWTSLLPGSCSYSLVQELRRLSARDDKPRWIWFSGASMAGVVTEARRLGYRVIVDQDRMPSSQVLRDASNHWSHWVRLPEAWRDIYYERRRCERAHAVVASSPLYAARVLKMAPSARVRVLAPSVDRNALCGTRSIEGRKLLFCGDLEDPFQQQGVLWLADEVLPRLRAALRAEMPEVVVAGPSASKNFLDQLAENGIQSRTWNKQDPEAAQAGMQESLREAMICFLPHREKKVGAQFLLQSMASGRPVVSTTKGCEGMLFTPGHDIWVGDQPDSFATALLRLIREPELRTRTRELADRAIGAHYDWNHARSTLSALLQEV